MNGHVAHCSFAGASVKLPLFYTVTDLGSAPRSCHRRACARCPGRCRRRVPLLVATPAVLGFDILFEARESPSRRRHLCVDKSLDAARWREIEKKPSNNKYRRSHRLGLVRCALDRTFDLLRLNETNNATISRFPHGRPYDPELEPWLPRACVHSRHRTAAPRPSF